jgi:hypothetical protein
MPPAFNLSQDQTLQLISRIRAETRLMIRRFEPWRPACRFSGRPDGLIALQQRDASGRLDPLVSFSNILPDLAAEATRSRQGVELTYLASQGCPMDGRAVRPADHVWFFPSDRIV